MFVGYTYWLLNDPVGKFGGDGKYAVFTLLYLITEADMLRYPQATEDMHVTSGHVLAQKYIKALHSAHR